MEKEIVSPKHDWKSLPFSVSCHFDDCRGCVPPDFCFHGPGTRYLLAREFLPQVGNVRYIRMAFPSTTVATVMGGGHLLCLCGNWKVQTMVFCLAHCQEFRTCSSISSHQTSRSRVGSWFETHYTKHSSNSLPKQFRCQPISTLLAPKSQ